MKNTLHIPQMDHKLITPFILQEAGLKVNGEVKLHADSPRIDHHASYDDEPKLRIHLQMEGLFSYFPTRELSSEECENGEIMRLFSTLLIP